MIEPSEAAIVRRIFGERLSGHGAAAIADGLNRDGVPSPRGGLWTRQAVRALSVSEPMPAWRTEAITRRQTPTRP